MWSHTISFVSQMRSSIGLLALSLLHRLSRCGGLRQESIRVMGLFVPRSHNELSSVAREE